MKKSYTFEEFLRDEFVKREPMVLDDALVDAFEHWLSQLEIEDWLDLGQEYGDIIVRKLQKHEQI